MVFCLYFTNTHHLCMMFKWQFYSSFVLLHQTFQFVLACLFGFTPSVCAVQIPMQKHRKTLDLYGPVKPNQNFQINPFRNFTNYNPFKTINFTTDRPTHLNLWLEVPTLFWNRLKKWNIRKNSPENIPPPPRFRKWGVWCWWQWG